MRIQHNILAMNAYRNYTNNTSALSKNLEKLSSGYKINRAGDDAAGLAISEKMRAQITGLSAAQKNVKDGISLVKTAEGALSEVHDMLNRMVSLATQSANGTYDGTDRIQLQKELDQLRTEINRISEASNFNGIKLLDGSMDTSGGVKNVDSLSRMLQTVGTGVENVGKVTILDSDPRLKGKSTTFEMDFAGLSASANPGTVSYGGNLKLGDLSVDENGKVSFNLDITDAKDKVLTITLGDKVFQIYPEDADEDAIDPAAENPLSFTAFSSDPNMFWAKRSSTTTVADIAAGIAAAAGTVTIDGNTYTVTANDTGLTLSADSVTYNGEQVTDEATLRQMLSDQTYKTALNSEVSSNYDKDTTTPGSGASIFTVKGTIDTGAGGTTEAASAKITMTISVPDGGGQFTDWEKNDTITLTNGGKTIVLTRGSSANDWTITNASVAGVSSSWTVAFDEATGELTLTANTQASNTIDADTLSGSWTVALSAQNTKTKNIDTTSPALSTVAYASGTDATKASITFTFDADPLANTGGSAYTPKAGDTITITYGSEGTKSITLTYATTGGGVWSVASATDEELKAFDVSLTGTTLTLTAKASGTTANAVLAANFASKGSIGVTLDFESAVTVTSPPATGTASSVTAVDGDEGGKEKAPTLGKYEVEFDAQAILDAAAQGNGITIKIGSVSMTYKVEDFGGTASGVAAKIKEDFENQTGYSVTVGTDQDGKFTVTLTKASVGDAALTTSLIEVSGDGVTDDGKVKVEKTSYTPANDGITTADEPAVVDDTGDGDTTPIRIGVKLGGKVLVDSVEIDPTDDDAAIAKKIFEALKKKGSFDETDGTITLKLDANGATYKVSIGSSGTSLSFELQDAPTKDNIKGNFDWNITGDTDKLAGNNTAGTTVQTAGRVTVDDQQANTVFRIDSGDIKEGSKFSITWHDENGKPRTTTVTLSIGQNQSDNEETGVVYLTEEEAKDLDHVLGRISNMFKKLGTGDLVIGVNDKSNGQSHMGLTVKHNHQSDDPKEDDMYLTMEDFAKVFSLTVPRNPESTGLTLQIGDTADAFNQLSVSIGACDTTALGLDNVNISTQSGAQKAIESIKAAINYVSDVRGTLGATQNRLEHTQNNLSVMAENIQDAESTIRDTDVAEEMMSYVKNNILIQSAQAMLAQANQIPQGVLQLLG